MAKPEIGLSMLYCLIRPFGQMIEQLPHVGLRSIEVLDEGCHELNRSRLRTLNDLAASYNLEFSMHAPFIEVNIASPSDWMLNATIKRLKKSIVNASDLNCKVWVFHPGLQTAMSNYFPGSDWKTNLKTACSLVKFAKDHGVKAAIENVPEPYPFIMKSVEDFTRFYSEISEEVDLALDLGHAHISGQTEKFIETFSERIIHVHAHDNNGKGDQHLGIGHGNIDWEHVAGLFEKIRYDKTIVVESGWDIEESIRKLEQLFL